MNTTSHPDRPSTPPKSKDSERRATPKRPYVKPRVEMAGSVFARTRAVGSGNKDIIVGSVLL